ncbi:MAG: hypothetical protein M1826_005280 [Phylliscum demangeonii]|nr:MAG: hypothetical protein M1826_005280 [Phylliscum demangeonii]
MPHPTTSSASNATSATVKASRPGEYITLVSNDGYEFVVRRAAAEASGYLRRMMDPRNNFSESISHRAVLGEINGSTLEIVCSYLYFHEKWREQESVADMPIPAEWCLELLMASEYLDVR